MTTFVIFIGIIALFIFGKFIFDTYLTNRTEKDWDQYKQSNPERAARIEKNKGFDFSEKSKSRDQDKRESLIRMARNLGCLPSQVKECFINGLKEQNLTVAQTEKAIQMSRQKKYEESKVFNIDPDDTAAAYMEEWTKEFLDNKEYAGRQRTERDIAESLLAENPELDRIVRSGDELALHSFLSDNPDLMDSILENLESTYESAVESTYESAEEYRDKAGDKFFDHKDYTGAIQLINKGLEFEDPQIEPYLYSLRAECQEKLLNYNDALKDMDKAIESILRNQPAEYYMINDFLKERAEIKKLLGDKVGASQDKKLAKEFYAKYEVNKLEGENND